MISALCVNHVNQECRTAIVGRRNLEHNGFVNHFVNRKEGKRKDGFTGGEKAEMQEMCGKHLKTS
jgi:hypothetical protein